MKIVKMFGNNNSICNDALEIRKAVFVEEQGISLLDELDSFDNESTHYVAYIDNNRAATVRVKLEKDNIWHIQRVATLKKYRHMGIASALLNEIITDARKSNINTLSLGAQIDAKKFYENLGFFEEGMPFLDANILHIKMNKKI